MRTTVEIIDSQHRALSALAQRRRLRGFSQIVQEALDAQLRDVTDDEFELLLSLEGSLEQRDEQELRTRIDATREDHRHFSRVHGLAVTGNRGAR